MPDCLILNPKLNPDPEYQDLCGAGVTFVLLRKLAQHLEFSSNHHVWTDILALTGMATICDVVPLGSVNHKLAKMGIDALMRSKRPVLTKLREAAAVTQGDEKDVGFRLGPRINAVGRLEHADAVVAAFIEEDPSELIELMSLCNDRRKKIQAEIVDDAMNLAMTCEESPIVFLGGDWHPGVVGIAASKMVEQFWKPTWLFEKKNGVCKGSARSIPGFDVTTAMSSCAHLFTKFGGHAAAGGFSFPEDRELEIKQALVQFARHLHSEQPSLWDSHVYFDCELPNTLLHLDVMDSIDRHKPFGHGFAEPKFVVSGSVTQLRYLNDRQTNKPKHTSLWISCNNQEHKIMFFNQVIEDIQSDTSLRCLVTLSRNTFRGRTDLQLFAVDYEAQL